MRGFATIISMGQLTLRHAALLLSLATGAAHAATDTREFCLDGAFDLGVRLQGMQPDRSETYPTLFCVVTEDGSGRVYFRGSGQSNPDMTGEYTVAYLPPDKVRLVEAAAPPDLEFSGKPVHDEAGRHRRIDPMRLVEELEANPGWVSDKRDNGWLTVRYPGSEAPAEIQITNGRLMLLRTTADLPLRGRVPVEWRWSWSGAEDGGPDFEVRVDGRRLFAGHSSWRTLSDAEHDNLWQPSGGQDPEQIPGEYWPASVDMSLEALADKVYFVRGVRTGFHHLVVDTPDGLVVGDAPAGWVEMPQIPPADLVPGLGISGLSEQFVDFLAKEFPDRPIRAVVLTHAHDDHAGGARAFAAAGADVYAPAGVAGYLADAFNRDEMPHDRLAAAGGTVKVQGVAGKVSLGSVELVNLGAGPHVAESLGVWAKDGGYFFQSDLHVPSSEDPEPRAGRAATECWFAEWAVANLPAETIVVTSHGRIRSPVSRLEKYTTSDACE